MRAMFWSLVWFLLSGAVASGFAGFSGADRYKFPACGGLDTPCGNASLADLMAQVSSGLWKFRTEGVLVLRQVLGSAVVDEVRRYIDELFHEVLQAEQHSKVLDGLHPTGKGKKNGHIQNAMPLDHNRIRLFCAKCRLGPSPIVRLIHDPSIRQVVRRLIGVYPQSVRRNQVQIFRHGSQQQLHQDSWYGLAGSRSGRMLSLSFALDDMDDANGPLIYVPRSHVWHTLRNFSTSALRRERLRMTTSAERANFQVTGRLVARARPVRLKAGDVVLWHEALLHGGAVIQDPSRKRRSVITHYKDWA